MGQRGMVARTASIARRLAEEACRPCIMCRNIGPTLLSDVLITRHPAKDDTSYGLFTLVSGTDPRIGPSASKPAVPFSLKVARRLLRIASYATGGSPPIAVAIPLVTARLVHGRPLPSRRLA